MFQTPKSRILLGAVSVGAALAAPSVVLADQTAAETAIAAAGTTAATVGWVVVAALAGLAVIKMVKRVM